MESVVSNLSGIQLAIDLAAKQRDTCHRNLAMLERHFTSAHAQMEQLRSYAADKDAGWIDATPGVFSGELLRHHYQFVGRLQQAMGMQAGVLNHANGQVNDARALLASAEIRLEGLSRILKLRMSTKDMLFKRREQKQTDDFASQQYARKRSDIEQGEVR